MVKRNDGDLVGLRARLVRCLMALEAAPHAHNDQGTQEQEPPEHQHQPAGGGDTELGQKGFVYTHLLISLAACSLVNLKAKQSHLGLWQAEFGQYPGMQICNPLQAPVQVLHHPQGKIFFLLSDQNFPVCSLVSHLMSFY